MASLAVRQILEGMCLTFDPEKAGDLRATIQWVVTGAEPGRYHHRIGDGICTFHHGVVDDPTLRVTTPSDVWQAIVAGEKDGAEALFGGEFTVDGEDTGLVLRIREIFRPRDEVDLAVERTPPGPLPLPGRVWLVATFLPWIVFFGMLDGPGAWPAVLTGLGISAAVAGYRMVVGGVTWVEIMTPITFLGLAGSAHALGDTGFEIGGSAMGLFAMAAIWGSSLLTDRPATAEYAIWDYVPAMAGNSQFRHTNGVITLIWAGLFLLSGVLSLGGAAAGEGFVHDIAEVLRFAVAVLALGAARWWGAGAQTRVLANLDADLVTQRGIGAAVTIAGVVLLTAVHAVAG